VYDSFLKDFDVNAHHKLMALIEPGVESYLQSKAFTGYGLLFGPL